MGNSISLCVKGQRDDLTEDERHGDAAHVTPKLLKAIWAPEHGLPPPDVPLCTIEPCGDPWDLLNRGIPSAPNEPERRTTSMAMGIYSAPKCPELDFITDTLSRIFDAPYTAIALYYNRTCWLSNTSNYASGNLPWTVSACPWNTLVTQPQTIVAGELQEDARFHHQPWTARGLRCYCSAPLLASNGHRLGTLCFMDTVPRRMDAGMCRVLNNFGELAVRVLERHLKLADRLAAAEHDLPASLTTLVAAAKTGRPSVSEDGPIAPMQGMEEGLWTEGIPEDSEQGATAASAGAQTGNGNGHAKSPSVPVSPQKPAPATSPVPKAPLPADALLTSVFNRQLRSIEAVQDACCLVVDTGMPGWPVIYADETWKLWSGIPRHELLGNKLQDFLAPATPGVAPLNWAALQREVDAGERFVVPGVIASVRPVVVHPIQPNVKAEALTYYRTNSQPPPYGIREHADAPAGITLKPVVTDGTHPRPSAENSSLLPSVPGHSVDMLATLSPRKGISAQSPTHTENLLEAVASHEAGQRFLLAARDSTASGIELWHEASGTAGSVRGSALHLQSPLGGTPTMSNNNLINGGSVTSAGSVTGGRPVKAFDLSFRPMALDVLDGDALPLGIPSFVPLEACATMLRLYAVRLHATTAAPMPAQPLTPALKITNRHNSTMTQLAGHLFPGLGMGQVLGRGGYGTAYTGTWHDVSVVVKVQDYMLEDAEALRTAQVEVALGQMLRHPYLVRTLAHGAAEVAPTPEGTPAGTPAVQSRAGDVHSSKGTPSPPKGQPAIYSGFSPLSKWLMDVEDDWEDRGDDDWFSHCSQDGMVRRTVLSKQSMADTLPSPAQFVNAVAIAGDAAEGHAPVAPDVPEARQPVQRQLTAQLLAALQDNLAAAPAAAPAPAPANALLAHVLEKQAAINYMAVVNAPAPPAGRKSPLGQGLANGMAPLGPGSVGHGIHLSAASSSVAPSVMRSSQSVTIEMAAMMASGQQHASRMGAKPMQFPMHLRTFAILEYCDGGTLSDAVDRGWLRKGSCHIDSPPDMLKIVKLAGNIACAAAYLHDRGVVHADLSAANVLLCSSKPIVTSGQDAHLTDEAAPVSWDSAAGRGSSVKGHPAAYNSAGVHVLPEMTSARTSVLPSSTEARLYTLPIKRYSLAQSTARQADELQFIAKVADFGKSCLLGPEGVIKAGGYATVTHMAPEVLSEHLLSPAADVYALGVLMWQMYTGSRPWGGLNHKQILSTVLSGELQLEWPASIVSDLPPVQQQAAARLTVLGRACLAHDAAARPTMAAVEAELAALVRLLEEAGV